MEEQKSEPSVEFSSSKKEEKEKRVRKPFSERLKPITGTKRKKRPDDADPDTFRKQRNRMAAARSRQRKRDYVKNLETELDEAKDSVTNLKTDLEIANFNINVLQKQVIQLIQMNNYLKMQLSTKLQYFTNIPVVPQPTIRKFNN